MAVVLLPRGPKRSRPPRRCRWTPSAARCGTTARPRPTGRPPPASWAVSCLSSTGWMWAASTSRWPCGRSRAWCASWMAASRSASPRRRCCTRSRRAPCPAPYPMPKGLVRQLDGSMEKRFSKKALLYPPQARAGRPARSPTLCPTLRPARPGALAYGGVAPPCQQRLRSLGARRALAATQRAVTGCLWRTSTWRT